MTRPVIVGSATATFAARLATLPDHQLQPRQTPPRAPDRESASKVVDAATTIPSTDSGVSAATCASRAEPGFLVPAECMPKHRHGIALTQVISIAPPGCKTAPGVCSLEVRLDTLANAGTLQNGRHSRLTVAGHQADRFMLVRRCGVGVRTSIPGSGSRRPRLTGSRGGGGRAGRGSFCDAVARATRPRSEDGYSGPRCGRCGRLARARTRTAPNRS